MFLKIAIQPAVGYYNIWPKIPCSCCSSLVEKSLWNRTTACCLPHRAIIPTNNDLPPDLFFSIHLRGSSHEVPLNLMCKIGSDITLSDYYLTPSGAIELLVWPFWSFYYNDNKTSKTNMYTYSREHTVNYGDIISPITYLHFCERHNTQLGFNNFIFINKKIYKSKVMLSPLSSIPSYILLVKPELTKILYIP